MEHTGLYYCAVSVREGEVLRSCPAGISHASEWGSAGGAWWEVITGQVGSYKGSRQGEDWGRGVASSYQEGLNGSGVNGNNARVAGPEVTRDQQEGHVGMVPPAGLYGHISSLSLHTSWEEH